MAKKELPIADADEFDDDDVLKTLKIAAQPYPSLSGERRAAEPPPAEVEPAAPVAGPPVSDLPAVRSSGLSGEVLPPDAEPKHLDEFVAVIGRLHREAEDRFLRIGTLLIQAKVRLRDGEWTKLVGSLPFGIRTVQMLMSAAKLVLDGVVPEDRLPISWMNAYLVSTLSDEALKIALEEGIINPRMSRRDIIEFKHRLRKPDRTPDPVRDEIERLLAEKERIEKRLAELQAQEQIAAD